MSNPDNQRIVLNNLQKIWKIGARCEIQLDQESVSSKHAALKFNEKFKLWEIYDCKSTFGTRINDRRIFPNIKYRINENDKIQFGFCTRIFSVQSEFSDPTIMVTISQH